MSMPIRRTTARLAFTSAMALGSAGLLAGAAIAQQYPPQDIEITVTTPGATIEIEGDGWDSGTTVTITRRSGNSAGGGGTEQVTATVREDGTFSAPIEVPEDAAGQEIQYEVSGVDEQGEDRTEVQALNVQLTGAEMDTDGESVQAAPATPEGDSDNGLIVGISAAGLAAVAGGSVFARRRALKG